MNNMTTTLESLPLPWQVRPLVALLERIARGTLELTTPEGYQLRFGDGGEPRADLQLKDWAALRRIFRNGDVGLAECYRDGLVTSDDLTALIRLGIQNQEALEQAIHGNRLLTLGYRIRHLLRFNSRRGSARNIGLHYDLGNEFYQLWLDESMTYTSAMLDGNLAQVQEQGFDARFIRLWRLYLAYCEAGFDEGRIDVAQLQLVKERAL